MTATQTDRMEPSGPRGMTPERQRIAAEALQSNALFKALASFGDFYAFVVSVFRKGFTHSFQFREFVSQAWFITTVSFWPALLVAIPFCVVIIFQVNQLLIEIGAVDLAGAGAAVAVVREIGPIVSVLVVAGAGATAICADLGSRKIREEIDAMTTLGIDPIHRLVVPRVAASTLVGIALNGLVTVVGLVGGYFFSVVLQGATPGLYLNDLTLLVGLSDFIAAEAKAAIFGLLAGLTACYLGLNAKGGPKGVGEAVNQTVVFAFMLLFAANSVISTLFLQFKLGA
ncbi:ABC transporter permease [Nocardioides sp. NPDC000445]|jgi:phospholipid/cholesterol/gamma-HCH transport system permease protein|uniref:Phospholipid/cholesterol/gamma-HCH transport system permease protein n=3 Tax=Nocardioides TaxID=1839 RepID=A0A543ACU4_9ACTN|nr:MULTISPECIES: ABC transporter permease [Nocardioides]EGD41033.1 putative YrbE family protein [Nocardioidaceae bacterium Broad-1]NYI80933.1 phospholipid/cholesterol/gamma-HCH transport system permease protein [Nocardioides panzhihuensis]TQL70403.1 phospholipid/cholesterol/gamma-HCH transport system permease protein [Nocardioides albertanoniae]